MGGCRARSPPPSRPPPSRRSIPGLLRARELPRSGERHVPCGLPSGSYERPTGEGRLSRAPRRLRVEPGRARDARCRPPSDSDDEEIRPLYPPPPRAEDQVAAVRREGRVRLLDRALGVRREPGDEAEARAV